MRIVLATVVSAVIVFMWGFVSWAALGIWSAQVPNLPDHDRVAAVMMEAMPRSGAYFFPPMPEMTAGGSSADQQAQMDHWTAQHREGPVGVIMFNREGSEPMAPAVFVGGIGLNLLGAFLMATVVGTAAVGGAGWWKRFAVAMAVAGFAVVTAHGSNWNWFHFPLPFTFAVVLDHLIGWSIAALVTASIVVDTRSVASLSS